MKFSDELLIAFVNGELAEPARAAVERAQRADPIIAARLAQHRARRSRVYGVVAGARESGASGPVPGTAGGAKVVQLDMVRAARAGLAPPAPPQLATWNWRQRSACALALVAAACAGAAGWHAWQGAAQLASMGGVLGANGALVAQGPLAAALDGQLASPGPSGRVRIGISFLAREGNYCRSFVIDTTAGLACRAGSQWAIPVLAQGAAGAAWMDGNGLPAAVSNAISERIVGRALGSAAERAVQARGWKSEG